MEKEFVTYELAIKLKELGFDEPCFGFYDDISKDFYQIHSHASSNNDVKNITKAPTWQSAFRWFREKYVLHSFIDCKWKNIGWEYELVDLNKMETISTIGKYGYNTPEEAELACLEKLIEIVEQKNNLDQNP
jgi:hypothetical protein